MAEGSRPGPDNCEVPAPCVNGGAGGRDTVPEHGSAVLCFGDGMNGWVDSSENVDAEQ